uniref:Zinc finger BED domaincontaining protein 1like [Aplysia californica] n=1 Tax=Lepeophtheirus salmonis TaxID=72036 RepID=A0A0K2TLY4_LEPSM
MGRVTKLSNSQKNKLDNLVLEMIISYVEDSRFRNLVSNLDPGYVLPNRKPRSNTLLPLKLDRMKTPLMGGLETAEQFSLTTDIWTSCNNTTYIILTPNFINRGQNPDQ